MILASSPRFQSWLEKKQCLYQATPSEGFVRLRILSVARTTCVAIVDVSTHALGCPIAALDTTLRDLASAFLAERYTLSLATNGPDGPWVAAVYFAGGLAELYFLSSPTSRHGRNLALDPRVAASINADEHDWRQIRGIQLEGECRPPATASALLRAWRAYLAKYPLVRGMLRGQGVPAGAAARMAGTRIYCLQPRRLFYLDNRLGFGNRQEIQLV
jgi:uncharacterized protein YhbP (UPF0306 family)